MDENVILQTLNSTLQRHAKIAANYETEITNLTAEVFRLTAELDKLRSEKEEVELRLANLIENQNEEK